MNRNLNLFYQLLNIIKQKTRDEFELTDRLFYENTNKQGDRYGNMIAAFSAVYELICLSKIIDYNNDNIIDLEYNGKGDIIKINQGLEQSLLDTYVSLSDLSMVDFKYDTTKCPLCNHEISTNKFIGRRVIIACPSCHKHFLYNGESWVPTRAKRKIDIEINDYKQGIKREIGQKEKELKDKYLEETNRLKRQYNYWLNDLEKKSKQEHERIDSILSSMPKWKRSLVKKYFKKLESI